MQKKRCNMGIWDEEQRVTKNTKNWYTIDALGTIFAIFTILDIFYKTFTLILQY